jgi:predicted esterase
MTGGQVGGLVRSGASAPRARAGLVLIHGRGGSAKAIRPLSVALGLPDLAVALPDHPDRSWWPTSFLAPHAQMAAPLAAGLDTVAHAIAALEAEGLSRSAIAVAGFSQGACLALEYAARFGAGLAGAFALSGTLVGTGDAPGDPDPDLYGFRPKAFDYDSDLSGLPVYLSVHERDPHIPLARSRLSAEVLTRRGAHVTLHVAPGAGHEVLAEDFAALRKTLNTGPD